MTRLRSVFRDELFVRQDEGRHPDARRGPDLRQVARRAGSGPRLRHRNAGLRPEDLRASLLRRHLASARADDRGAAARAARPRGSEDRDRLFHPVAPDRDRAGRCAKAGSTPRSIGSLPERGRFRELTLFEDSVVAVARTGHPALRRTPSISELKKGAFVSACARASRESIPSPGIREWRRLGAQLRPRSLGMSRSVHGGRPVGPVRPHPDEHDESSRSDAFGLRPLRAGPKPYRCRSSSCGPRSREADAAHVFLRKQMELASSDVVPRRSR